jgi:hypothetical protein
MRIERRGVAALSSIILLAFALGAGALAQTAAKSLKDQLVGHWRLVSVTTGGAEPYGASPQGDMVLGADGHYSVIVISAGRAPSIAYFGAYTVDEASSAMTLHIEASTRPTSDGRDEKRAVSLNGDQLIQSTAAGGGARGDVKVTWKRS